MESSGLVEALLQVPGTAEEHLLVESANEDDGLVHPQRDGPVHHKHSRESEPERERERKREIRTFKLPTNCCRLSRVHCISINNFAAIAAER